MTAPYVGTTSSREGPTDQRTSVRFYCGLCKWLEGKPDHYYRPAKQRYYCCHKLNGKLRHEIEEDGHKKRFIGFDDLTPVWCPFLTGMAQENRDE